MRNWWIFHVMDANFPPQNFFLETSFFFFFFFLSVHFFLETFWSLVFRTKNPSCSHAFSSAIKRKTSRLLQEVLKAEQIDLKSSKRQIRILENIFGNNFSLDFEVRIFRWTPMCYFNIKCHFKGNILSACKVNFLNPLAPEFPFKF